MQISELNCFRSSHVCVQRKKWIYGSDLERKRLVRTALVIFSTLCSGSGHWGAIMTYKSSGICPCLRLESSDSRSQFLAGIAFSHLSKASLLNFWERFWWVWMIFLGFFSTNGPLHIQFHTFTQGSCPTTLKNSHCRGNGMVTNTIIPHTDFLSPPMVSTWRPSQHKAIFPTLVPLPPKVDSFNKLGGDVEASF